MELTMFYLWCTFRRGLFSTSQKIQGEKQVKTWSMTQDNGTRESKITVLKRFVLNWNFKALKKNMKQDSVDWKMLPGVHIQVNIQGTLTRFSHQPCLITKLVLVLVLVLVPLLPYHEHLCFVFSPLQEGSISAPTLSWARGKSLFFFF